MKICSFSCRSVFKDANMVKINLVLQIFRLLQKKKSSLVRKCSKPERMKRPPLCGSGFIGFNYKCRWNGINCIPVQQSCFERNRFVRLDIEGNFIVKIRLGCKCLGNALIVACRGLYDYVGRIQRTARFGGRDNSIYSSPGICSLFVKRAVSYYICFFKENSGIFFRNFLNQVVRINSETVYAKYNSVVNCAPGRKSSLCPWII